MLAPAKIADVIRASTKLSFEEGKKLETKGFYELATGPQARALQQTFFAQRAVSKIPGIDVKNQALSVKEVGIIGSGLMGGGIAMCFAQKGFKVILKDIKQEFLDKGVKTITKNWKRSSVKGKWSPYQVKEMIKLIQPSLNYESLKNTDLVIEAAFENMSIKKEIFNNLSKFCKSECIFATNTSTLNIDEIAKASDRPEKVIGLHFFSPANVMQLLESIRGAYTSDSTIATAIKIGKVIGKVPVLVGNCFGFVGNRVIFSYTAIAGRLVEEGCSPYDIDKVILNFGMPMGPFQMSDLSGLDVGYKIRNEGGNKFHKDDLYYPFTVDDRMYELGNFGQKTKKGYYSYSKSRRGKPRETIISLVKKVRNDKNIPQRKLNPKEIQQRLIFSLINEGMHCLEEKIALRPMDIDVILIFGYGFPAQLGGPMFYCDELGLMNVYSKIKEYQSELLENPYWKNSRLFEECATENIGIHKYFMKNTKSNKAKL